MARQLIKCVLLGAVALAAGGLFPAQRMDAQEDERSWRLAVWLKGGYQQPYGSFAQSQPSQVDELQNYVSQFRVDPSNLIGAGVELRFPAHGMGARLGWERSTIATARGKLGICNILEGPICEEELADSQFQALLAEFRFLMRQPRDRIRPLLLLGSGIREMAIDAPACDPDAIDPMICRTIVGLYENPVPHMFIRLGLGFEASPGPVVLNAVGTIGTARYGSTTDHVHGQWYNEFRVELSAGYIVY